MLVDDKLIAHLEELSFLSLSADEKERMKADLGDVLSSMSGLAAFKPEALDGAEAAECTHPLDSFNVFREDEARPSYDRDLILKNGPNSNGEMLVAPKTVV